ncbi:hypothetical protein Pmani_018514 [Petrolisthes manimaculis]|uniref:Uncharacterized protein n=1 Tax=Petrolisthes manimaculis TaxID=1843537 RepID=A0AAE1PKV5_9EUCA|nr:hypothetical protein Pmani_018514 [Petrolisthes manimaculis]
MKFLVSLACVQLGLKVIMPGSEAVIPEGPDGPFTRGGNTPAPRPGGAEYEDGGGRRARGYQRAPPSKWRLGCGGDIGRLGGAPGAPGVVTGAGAPPARISSSRRTPRRQQPRPARHPGHMSSVWGGAAR